MKNDSGRLLKENELYSPPQGEPRFSKANAETRDVMLKLSEKVGKQIEEIFAKKVDSRISK